MTVRPKFNQHSFDHMRRLIQTVKDRAETQHDAATSLDAELLDALSQSRSAQAALKSSVPILPQKLHHLLFFIQHAEKR